MLEVLARIRHRRIRRQLSPYLDGMLSARESRRLEAHLAQCQACRDELAELRATVQALAELPLAEAPRSFALSAAPRRVEAMRPAARRLEFGLRLATAAAAFTLAVVAVIDLLGVPAGEEEERSLAARVELEAAPTEVGAGEERLQESREATAEGAGEDKAADQAVAEAPTAPPAAAGGVEGEATAEPPSGFGFGPSEGYGAGGAATATPSEQPPTLTLPPEPGFSEPLTQPATPAATALAEATGVPAATATPAETPATAEMPAPAETPATVETPPAAGLAGTPEVASPGPPEMAAATATPLPVGAQIAPSEPEEPLPSQPEEQALADADREALAAEEGGPSRETVVRWLEIGLGAGLALLFVSWFLARRRGQA